MFDISLAIEMSREQWHTKHSEREQQQMKKKKSTCHLWFWLFDDKWWIGLTCVQVFFFLLQPDNKSWRRSHFSVSTLIFITKINKCTDISYKLISTNRIHSKNCNPFFHMFAVLCMGRLNVTFVRRLSNCNRDENGKQLLSIKSGSLCSFALCQSIFHSRHTDTHTRTRREMSFHFFRTDLFKLTWTCQKQAQRNDCMQIRNSWFLTIRKSFQFLRLQSHLFYAFVSYGNMFHISMELKFILVLIDP